MSKRLSVCGSTIRENTIHSDNLLAHRLRLKSSRVTACRDTRRERFIAQVCKRPSWRSKIKTEERPWRNSRSKTGALVAAPLSARVRNWSGISRSAKNASNQSSRCRTYADASHGETDDKSISISGRLEVLYSVGWLLRV